MKLAGMLVRKFAEAIVSVIMCLVWRAVFVPLAWLERVSFYGKIS